MQACRGTAGEGADRQGEGSGGFLGDQLGLQGSRHSTSIINRELETNMSLGLDRVIYRGNVFVLGGLTPDCGEAQPSP